MPGTDPSIDGVALDFNVVGNSNYSSAFAHAVGHFLDLYHTFQGGTSSMCPPNYDYAKTGDKCIDTEPHKRITTGCDENTTNDCTSNPLGDLVHNIMSSFPYSCHYLFTHDQIMRMRAALMSQRSGLIESLGCTSPCNTTSTDFTPSALEVVVGQSLYFTNTTTPSNSTYMWSVEGFSFTTTDIYYPFNVPGRILVSLRSTYQGCTNEHREYIDVILPETCSYIYPDCELLYNGTFAENHLTIGTQNHFVPTPQVNHENKVCNWINKRETPFFCSRIDDDIFGLRTDSEALQESIVTQEEIPFEDGKIYKVTFEYLVGNSLNYQSNEPEPKFVIGLSHSSDFGNLNDDVILEVLSGLGYDFYDTGGDCIDINPNFNYHEFTFPYTSNMGKYLFFQNCFTAMPDQNQVSNIYLRDIHIPFCEDCISVPEFTSTIEDCSVSFVGTNLGDEALSYLWDFGDGTSSTSQNVTHEYLFPGTFTVCLNVPCSPQLSATKCKEITILGPCSNCSDLGDANAIACSIDEFNLNSYLSNISTNVPHGYRPCLGNDLFIYSENVNIEVNSFEFLDSGPGDDILNAGVIINTPLGYNLVQEGAVGYLILCDPFGEEYCFTIDFIADECDKCINIDVPISAICNETLSDQNTFVYDGTIVVDVDDNSLQFTGFLSSELGFEVLSYSQSVDVWTINFRITVENLFFTITDVILYFEVEETKLCVNMPVLVTEICSDLPVECVEEWDVKEMSCLEDPRENYAVFPFAMQVSLNGYQLCEGGLFGTINGGGIVEILYDNVQGPKLNFGLNILMPLNFNQNQIYYLRLYLCDNEGDMVCYLFPFDFSCSLGFQGGLESRSSSSESNTDLFTVIPNPANSTFILNLSDFLPDQIFDIELVDMVGKLILHKELNGIQTIVDISSLPEGLYSIRMLKNDKVLATERLVIMH